MQDVYFLLTVALLSCCSTVLCTYMHTQLIFSAPIFHDSVYDRQVTVAAYVDFFPETHCQILAAHQYTPQKELLFWFNCK